MRPSVRRHFRSYAVLLVLISMAGCSSPAPSRTASVADSIIPSGPFGDAVRRGKALVLATRDSLPGNVGNKLRCTSCHLDVGRRETGTWIGVFARYPQYRARSGVVETIEYRVNDCFRRSMNGTALDPASDDMRDIVAYLAFLSKGVTVGPPGLSLRLQKWAVLTADPDSGSRVYAAVCAKCHGTSGEGTAVAPPVWGPDSYNIGAGMSRVRAAAEFISRNMPFDAPGTLRDADAFNVAAFINAHTRPDFAGKENDWPNGDPPPDVAYPTRAHH
ncbi:MAG TPA: c-type cytochrome [Gemmatimonadales bacterium]|nr:c-type cytochrome [Gemmatimonadales bacterium]